MRIAIATRIFEPEPSAASFRLNALAKALSEAGHDVTVLTVRPRNEESAADSSRPFEVRRFPVLRDKAGYVRGYFQYLSFDVPLFFRLVLGRRYDALVIEPPPTTGFVARIAAWIRRTPYFYYGADVWSEAAESTGASSVVVRAVRWMESVAVKGAQGVLSVNAGVTDKFIALVGGANFETIGNGIDTDLFTPTGDTRGNGDFFIYTGTASEWQGAEVFIRAMAELRRRGVETRVVFLGSGSAWSELRVLAAELRVPVEFLDPVPPAEAAAWLRGAKASLASIRPNVGYDFAFPTKLYASWATGTPTIFAGDEGPARLTLRTHPELGQGVDYEVSAVANAMLRALEHDATTQTSEDISKWARANVSLAGVAQRAVLYLEKQLAEQPMGNRQ